MIRSVHHKFSRIVSQAVHSYIEYQKLNSKANTVRNYEFVLTRFQNEFGDRTLESITPDEVLLFLGHITEGTKQSTKKNRYTILKTFFNFIRNTIDENIQNPCDIPIMRQRSFMNRRRILYTDGGTEKPQKPL